MSFVLFSCLNHLNPALLKGALAGLQVRSALSANVFSCVFPLLG